MRNTDESELERLVGEPIISHQPGQWGFTNRTDLVTLEGGERLVVQRYRRRSAAEYRLRIMQALHPVMQQLGIAIPETRRFDLNAEPPWAIFTPLLGQPVPEAGDAGLDGPKFPAIARLMGEWLQQLRQAPTSGLPLNDTWTRPKRLATHAAAWLTNVPELNSEQHAALSQIIHTWPALFSNRQAVFAHGDYAPVNILTDGEVLTGLVDFESARLADPLFDIAWWAWVVKFHHPGVFPHAWPSFLQGAGIDPGEPQLQDRIRAIQVLHLLELVADPNAISSHMRSLMLNQLQTLLL
jgi:aminoglycoside phosphotransferase (APT) family kinase protein